MSDDTVNIFCAQLKTSEECTKNFPADMWATIDGGIKGMDAEALKQRTGKFKSMFLQALDMISSYNLKQ